MAWTAPRTWVAAEVPTAATMQAHTSDNLTFLKSDHGCRLYTTVATTTLTTLTESALAWDTELLDTDGFHSTSSTRHARRSPRASAVSTTSWAT